LILNIAGSGRLTPDLILIEAEAIEMAAFHQPGGAEHEKRRLLEANAVLKESRNIQIGLVLISVGFLGQLVGTLLW
jgi:hypothetical protein